MSSGEPLEYQIDVRGQTCPGYLLSIHRAVSRLPAGSRVLLRISYPPCGDDVRVWCTAHGHRLESLETVNGEWRIRLRLAD